MDAVRIWAHRGGRGPGMSPENSLNAFVFSVNYGIHGIELDVFSSADDRLVVFHDDSVERLTNGEGKIFEKKYAYLKRLRLKNYEDQGKENVAEKQLSDQTIPLLDHVMIQLREWCKVTLRTGSAREKARARDFVVNIEIKAGGIALKLADAIHRYEKQGWPVENFLVSSFDMNSLREMRKRDPRIAIGTLFCSEKAPWDVNAAQVQTFLGEVKDIRPDTVNVTYPSLTPKVVRLIREAGARPVGWTVGEINPRDLTPADRQAIAAHLRKYAITLITDFPREMLALLQNNHVPRKHS